MGRQARPGDQHAGRAAAEWGKSLSFGERERRRVDAVAQTGRSRSVGEDVAQMASAARAGDFDSAHAKCIVFVLADHFGVGGES